MKLFDWLGKNWLAFAILLIPLALLAWFWNQIPEEVASLWNAAGEIDGYSGRWSLLIGPLSGLGSVLLVLVLTWIDPKKSIHQYQNTLQNVVLILSLFMSIISMGIILYAANYDLNVPAIIIFSVLGINLFLGNLFGKIKPNYFVGIRTPWTLESESVWRKTHRLSGIVWVVASLTMMLLFPFFRLEAFIILFLAYLSVIIMIPLVYSYQSYRQEKAAA